jgi:hypothetical protein
VYTQKERFAEGFINDMLIALFFKLLTKKENVPNGGKGSDVM